jgi:hypothetical protein
MGPASRDLLLVCLLTFVAFTPAFTSPIVCDLRTEDSCAINGGIFAAVELQPTGTGVINSFLRVQEKGTEQGYNTSYRPVQFDEKTDPNFTRDLSIAEVGITTIGGLDYATFYLDINEPSAREKEFLTLDQLELFTTDETLRTGYTGTANTSSGDLPGTTKIYDLDFGADNYVQLSYNRFAGGSGQSDMAFYLPMSLFTGNYVNLFSQFGIIDNNPNKFGADKPFGSEAGFEEWFSVESASGGQPPPVITAVPEPATLALVGIGLLALTRHARKRLDP